MQKVSWQTLDRDAIIIIPGPPPGPDWQEAEVELEPGLTIEEIKGPGVATFFSDNSKKLLFQRFDPDNNPDLFYDDVVPVLESEGWDFCGIDSVQWFDTYEDYQAEYGQ